MPIRVDLLALEPNVPGRACLTVKKWQGAQEQLEFSIQRNQDSFYLQEGQVWSNNPCWFQVSRFDLAANGEALEAQVGADVVDPLLEGGANSQFRIELREQGPGQSDVGVVRPGVGLLPSTAGGETRSTYGAAQLSTPSAAEPEIPELPELVLPEIEAPVEPEPITAEPVYTPPPAPVKKSNKGLIGLIIVVLLLLAAAAAFWWLKRAPEPTAPAVAATPAAGADAAACTLESMNSLPELTFVQTCIKAAPDSAKLLEIINQAKAGKHCGVAQRLYANRAQAGDALIANAYAHEYDPKYLKASDCFPTADNATAAYWYETILTQDPNNAEAKQRFEELQK
ncbi:Uncharacterised protein [Pseudomonas fluorescens]|uniref:Uncharacterized protein n=1 Tax=Pseudomonas fluorescens TaxID=294 RepID=A0A3S4RA44_PSEFL|nr:hypothetical protein [Pseudomonas fluorescens]VEF13606.1 Uncharacterised protein [Pseudomonas fluorescens]